MVAGFSLTEKGQARLRVMVLVFFPVCLLFAMAVWECGDAMAEGPEPPDEGDWVLRGITVVQDSDLTAPANIIIEDGATVHFINTTLKMAYVQPGQHTLFVEDGALLHVYGGSSLDLDRFVASPGSTVNLLDCTVRTTGEMLLHSNDLVAENVTMENIVRQTYMDEPGHNAVLVLNGSEGSGFTGVTIRNHGGDAGMTSPGMNGSRGGESWLISNISIWRDCTIDVRAGKSRSGGLGLSGDDGGSGGGGSDAKVHLVCVLLESTTIEVWAGDGGVGARGSDNTAGNGGSGGDGAAGGNGEVIIESPDVLEVISCHISANGGLGGSGNRGGDAINGTAGEGGRGAMGGAASIQVTSRYDMDILDCDLDARGGFGGYGGDYGRHEGGLGEFGIPRKGGNGGNATIEVISELSIDIAHIRADAKGGNGMDGGGGYVQGERGGDGGDAVLRVRAHTTVIGFWIYLNSTGGRGGDGGPSFAEIRGPGGDGGDALLEYVGLMEMRIKFFTLRVNAGVGGTGNTGLYDGMDGIPTFDLDTEHLVAREGEFNQPLDDLHGDARGYLFNVSFDMEFSTPVLPIGNAIVEAWFPVTIHGLDAFENGDPIVGYEVTVTSVATGALIGKNVTDENGETRFFLLAFTYTSTQVIYHGSYYFRITTPDWKTTIAVRGEIQGPSTIAHVIQDPWEWMDIYIMQPEQGNEYRFYSDGNDSLEVWGFIHHNVPITGVSIQLVPVHGSPEEWPSYKLGASPVPMDQLGDKEFRWGKFFPPSQNSTRWHFYLRIPIFDDDAGYHDGIWTLVVRVTTLSQSQGSSVTIDLRLNENIGKPWVILHTPLDGEVFDGSEVSIQGTAHDDHHILRVEVSVDGGEWEAIASFYEWTYHLDTGVLGEGLHTADFRAFDGRQYSDVHNNTFEVRLVEPIDGDDDDDGPNWDRQTYMIAAGLAMMAMAMVLLLVLFVVKVRSGPDSSGER